METMTVHGTEKRVDELSKRLDFGFEQMDRRFEEVDQRFDRIEGQIAETQHGLVRVGEEFVAVRREMNAGFEKLNRTIIYLLGGALSVLVSVFAGALVAAVLHALL